MNVDMTSFFVPKWLPERAKSVRYHISFEDDAPRMTPIEFWELSRQNPDFRAELTKDGEVILMPPTGFETSDINSEINFQLRDWAKKDRTGTATESNAGFILPNGATYSPDAAWTLKSRLDKFSKAEKEKFLPLCPDFVVELRSKSDSLTDLKTKMEEYMENGARLGWLIDPKEQKVHTYMPNEEVKILENPKTVSGENVLPGFELDMAEIW